MVEYKVGFVSNVLLPVIATLFTNNLPGSYVFSADVPITIWLELLTCALYPMAVEKDNVLIEDDVFDPINVLFVPEDRVLPLLYPRPVLFDPFSKEIKLIIPIPLLLSFVDEYKAPSPYAELLVPVTLLIRAFNPTAVLWLPVVFKDKDLLPTEVLFVPVVIIRQLD